MLMTNKDLVAGMFDYGQTKARELRTKAPSMADTEIIDNESFIPEWRPGLQKAGAPVRRKEIDQNYRTLQGHDSTNNPNWTPEREPALFGIMHTTDPEKAKEWVDPFGISGLYYLNECYRAKNGAVYQQTYDGGNEYDAEAMPDRWVKVR